MKRNNSLRLMTYNIGGTKSPNYSFGAVLTIVKDLSPDFLCIQETVEKTSSTGKIESQVEKIASILGKKTYHSFGPTISISQHFHPSKNLFVDLVFNDIEEWKQGNAFVSKKGFVQLGNQLKRGEPRNLPLFTPVAYEGNRNTDPRKVLISRLNLPHVFPYVIGTHLTTLVGEHDTNQGALAHLKNLAQKMRLEQTQKILQIVSGHILQQNKTAILLGDFNAYRDESCIADVLEAGGKFVRLTPENEGKTQTVDHILIFPGNNCINYRCRVYDEDIAKIASDHLPIYADITISNSDSEEYSKQGVGVFARYNE